MGELPRIIISSNKSINDYLGIIFKLGKYNDEIAIRYMDNYIDMIDSFLLGLRKSFGWLQEGPVEKVEDDNKKCITFDDDLINKPNEPSRRGSNYGRCKLEGCKYSKCTFQVRKVCDDYKQKDKSRFVINQVIIRKHGSLRGL